jgi:hypothetical protein
MSYIFQICCDRLTKEGKNYFYFKQKKAASKWSKLVEAYGLNIPQV